MRPDSGHGGGRILKYYPRMRRMRILDWHYLVKEGGT